MSISGGSTLQAMALAVERAAVVLVCMSQVYKDSASCRTGIQPKFRCMARLGVYCTVFDADVLSFNVQQQFQHFISHSFNSCCHTFSVCHRGRIYLQPKKRYNSNFTTTRICTRWLAWCTGWHSHIFRSNR